MDKHLNIFCSYDKGSEKDLKTFKQLEDNITRSFIITLMHLEKPSEFINNILEKKITNKPFRCDLQNVDDEKSQKIIWDSKYKVLLTISRTKRKITLDSFKKQDSKLLTKLENLNEQETKDVLKRIKDYYQKTKDIPVEENITQDAIIFKKLGIEIDRSNCKSLYQLVVQETRPDAWIFNSDVAILIESKIGQDKIYNTQLFRHLTRKNGFNIKEIEILHNNITKCELEIISITWEDIIKKLNEIDGNNEYIKNFKEYLVMCGETFSFETILNQKDNTFENRKNQLRFISERISKLKVVKDMGLLLNRKQISGHAWQQLGENGKLHFSLYVSAESAGVDLTLRDSIKNKIIKEYIWKKFFNLLWNNFLKEGVNEEIISHRYQLYFSEYHIFDHYKGLQTGGLRRSEFLMQFDTEWFRRYNIDETKAYELLFDLMKGILRHTIQFGIKYEIPYPDLDERDRRLVNNRSVQRYESDYNILINPSEFINKIEKFIKAMKPIYELLQS